jgi:hypothetical protein
LNQVCFTVAGLTVAVTLPRAEWGPPTKARLGKFQTELAPDLLCRLLLEHDLSKAPQGEPRVEQEADGLYLRHDNFEAHLPPRGEARLTIYQAGDLPEDALYVMVLDSFLRMAFAQLLLARGGLMFHAAGIAVSPQAGYVFFGPSGSGKTTICGLSHPRYRILCDEIIAVRPDKAGYRLYGTPFNGAWGDSLPEDVPLNELFYLAQAPLTRRVPITASDAIGALMESAVFYNNDTATRLRLLDALTTLVFGASVSQLEFIPKESLWETVLPMPTP